MNLTAYQNIDKTSHAWALYPDKTLPPRLVALYPDKTLPLVY